MQSLFLAAPILLVSILTPAAAAPDFPVIPFFEGRTEGEGTIKVALSARKPISVSSRGWVEADGTLVLVQTVRQAGKQTRTRTWRMLEVSPNRYAGTLTDATGPVKGQVSGDRLHLSYRMRGGFDIDQKLTLAPGGQTARNRMVVRKFGVPVARVDETIRKRD